MAPTGGTITQNGSVFTHTFLSSGTFVTDVALTGVAILVIGGGGGAGPYGGGGGGGGGADDRAGLSFGVGSYAVTVGAGGYRPTHGATAPGSSIAGVSSVPGGGNGGDVWSAGGGGGESGGGGSTGNSVGGGSGSRYSGGAAGPTDSQSGAWNGGGGAGWSGPGAPGQYSDYAGGGNGGNGYTRPSTGLVYSGGGGGGGSQNSQGAPGGSGGGGHGAGWNYIGSFGTGENGVNGTGGGGGGSADSGVYTTGGSGIVIISYTLPAPANTALPGITGTPKEGQTLTSTPGTWTNATSIYRYMEHAPAPGGPWSSGPGSTTWTLPTDGSMVGRYVRAVEQATGPGGVAYAWSAGLGPVIAAAPANTVAPALGASVEGSAPPLTPGTWTNMTSVVRYWYLNGRMVGTTMPKVPFGYAGASLRVVEQATGPGGMGEASSNTVTISAGPKTHWLALGTRPIPYEERVLADSPVGYWKMEEASGFPQDRTGRYHATGSGGAAASYGVAGVFGNAIKFNAGYFGVPEAPGLVLNDVWTCEAWVKILANPTPASWGIISKVNSGYCMRIQPNGTIMLIKSLVAVLASSTISLTFGVWHHVVGTKNGPSVHIYIDGVDVTGTVTDAVCGNTANGLQLGADSSEFSGAYMDEMAVYNYALPAARVQHHYAALLASPNWVPLERIGTPPSNPNFVRIKDDRV